MYPAQMRAVKSVLDALFLDFLFFIFCLPLGQRLLMQLPQYRLIVSSWNKPSSLTLM